jgi:hypothetical protein
LAAFRVFFCAQSATTAKITLVQGLVANAGLFDGTELTADIPSSAMTAAICGMVFAARRWGMFGAVMEEHRTGRSGTDERQPNQS